MTVVVGRAEERGQTPVVVRPHELGRLLDAFGKKIEVLSLDCFDTLLWRRTAAPTDVFFSLAKSTPFRALGFDATLRVKAEMRARSLASVRTGSSEVDLNDIYRAAFPELTDHELFALADAELRAEEAACYGYPATLELVRAAKARDLTVVIASDTYLREPELRQLLERVLPPDVMGGIDRIFCSSEAGRSKSAGLLRHVLSVLRVRPDKVLHLGDNPAADVVAARAAGMHAAHLLHHAPRALEMQRLSGVARTLLCPEIRAKEPLESPFRGVLALDAGAESPERLLGYHGVGPLLYAFGRFVLDEVSALERSGRRPKVLFLMRDAYLPSRVCEAIAGHPVGQRVAVSRFAAYAASFRSLEDVDAYLARSAGSGRFESMAKQLLLPEPLARELIRKAEATERSIATFVSEVRRPRVVETIVERSRAYAERFYRYLEQTVGLEATDSLVLVNLGYEGTAQRQLEPVLKAERGLDVQGRYLIAARVPGWESSRRGLMNPSSCDDRTLGVLTRYIALVEDLCTSDGQSVVDFSESGEPLGAPKLIAEAQLERVRAVQEECVAFARDAERFFASTGDTPRGAALTGAAIGALGRLLFFPSEPEIDFLDGFRLDMNLATDDSFALFDRQAGLDGLKRRGLFFMEHGSSSLRMNYPIELRTAGLELGLTLLAQERYGLELTRSDFTLRHEPVPVLVTRGTEATTSVLEARATHDGYFALEVPVGSGGYQFAVLFGQRYAWVQIEAVELIENRALYRDTEAERSEDMSTRCQADGLVHKDSGLYECATPAAFLFVAPVSASGAEGPFTCRVVFRPVAVRPKPG